MHLPDSSLLTNITVQGHNKPGDILFEKKYITIRNLENRLYTDAELARLPDLPAEHPHCKEWQLRKQMLHRLCRYLAKRSNATEILEIGCGNGWLAHHLAETPGTLVTGLDINFTELQQAARVFSGDPNLCFVHGDIRSGILAGRRFDIIIFSASIEYFSSLKRIILTCLDYLNADGEIHIVDTRFYGIAHIEWARKKTRAYYSSFGYPEMADHHFHYSLNDLKSFHYSVLYDPDAVRRRFIRNKSLCHWIRIRNN
jgi:SAM-dependent methyltransferase